MFEIPAGGRRYRALERLVQQKRLSKTALIPCVVRDRSALTTAEEDSLAENVHRVALHPLDQFRAFKTLREQGADVEEIAARFFVTPAVVKQRLRLASVSEKLLDIYAEDGMTLEQLHGLHDHPPDQARQEQVWEALRQSSNKEPYLIRRQLTESAVRASDRRARFVGLEHYEAAGGAVLRDLFEEDGGGWLQDVALLDRLATEKLAAEAREGRHRRLEVDRGRCRFSLRPRAPSSTPSWRARRAVTREEQATFDALTAEIGQASRVTMKEPMSSRTMSMPGLARSRPRSRRSTIVRFATILPRLRAPASFVSIDRRWDASLSIEATSGREDEPSPGTDDAVFMRSDGAESAPPPAKPPSSLVGGVEAAWRR